MRLHTDVLTEQDIRDAAKGGTIAFDRLTEHGSRSHKRAFEVAWIIATGRDEVLGLYIVLMMMTILIGLFILALAVEGAQ